MQMSQCDYRYKELKQGAFIKTIESDVMSKCYGAILKEIEWALEQKKKYNSW